MIIQLEGCEASGKSVLLKQLAYYLQELGLNVKVNHFPSNNTNFGNLAQDLLYKKNPPQVNTNLLITLAAIADQHLCKLEMDEYYNNKTNAYIASRGVISTLVYSDLFNNTSTSLTTKVLQFIEYLPRPDAIIYLNPSIDEVSRRLKSRNGNKSIYDQIDLATVIKTKYESVFDCLEHKYSILHINDDSLLDSLNLHLRNIYEFVYNI